MLKTAAYDYSCVMVNLPDDTLNAIQAKIDPADLYTAEPEYGLETEPHVTILYGLHTNDLADVQKVVEKTGINFVRVKLTSLSLFENERYDVLKYTVESEDLTTLNEAVKKLPFTSKFPKYNPHCTVAYLKKGTGKKYLDEKPLNETFKSILWTFSPSKGLKTKQPFNSQFVINRLRRKMKQGMEKEAIAIPGFLKNLGNIFKSAPNPLAQQTIKPDLLQSMISGRDMVRGGEAVSYLPSQFSPANNVIKILRTAKPSFDVNNKSFGGMDGGFLRKYNVEPRFDQTVLDGLKWRNMVPGAAPARQIGVEQYGRPVLEQPFVKGIDASYKDIRHWFRDNNIAQVRKGNDNVIGMQGIGRRSPQGISDGVAARAGVARVSDPIAGIIPRNKYLLLDDIKPQNFRFDLRQGKAIPIDVMANPITRRQAWQVPQIRRQMVKSYLTRTGVGATALGGGYAANEQLGLKDRLIAFLTGSSNNQTA